MTAASIIEALQRIMKGLTRAAVESALDIKELGVVEHAQQPELIIKKSDASGHYHAPLAEWFASFIDNKGGARLIGVENDTFTVLTGDTTLQAVLKALDTYLKSNFLDSAVYEMSSTEFVVNPLEFNVRMWKIGGMVFCDLSALTTQEINVTAPFLQFDLPAGWVAAHAPLNDVTIPVLVMDGSFTYIPAFLTVSPSTNIRLFRVDGANWTATDGLNWPAQTVVWPKSSVHPIVP